MFENAKLFGVVALAGLVCACIEPGDQRADTAQRFNEIGNDETLNLIGTEPFWSIVVEGDQLTFSTPSDIDGEIISVSRFNGNNGLGLSGTIGADALEIAVTPGDCNDGMSDRHFPFTATIKMGEEVLTGCGYSDSNPVQGDE
ncbi:MAG: hypothetical protein ABJP48_13550 [Erythrobacter sp.]